MALERHVKVFEESAETLAALDVGKMWDRLLGEFLDRWVQLDRQNLPDDELEAEMQVFMDGLSDKPVEDIARKSSSVAYNEGRRAEILTALDQGEANFAIRSEILDERTCAECARLDQTVVEVGTPQFDQFMPPAFCLGGDRCRGFYVMVAA